MTSHSLDATVYNNLRHYANANDRSTLYDTISSLLDTAPTHQLKSKKDAADFYSDIVDFYELIANAHSSYDTTTDASLDNICSLDALYFDTSFCVNTDTFTRMSDAARTEYHADLSDFYTCFTGRTSLPSNIQSFCDIQLTDMAPATCNYTHRPRTLLGKYAENMRRLTCNTMTHIGLIQHAIHVVFDDKHARIQRHLTRTQLDEAIMVAHMALRDMADERDHRIKEGAQIMDAFYAHRQLQNAREQLAELDRLYGEWMVK